MTNFCRCHQCKKMRRKGLVLGGRYMGFWIKGFTGKPEYYYGPVSDYVPHPKFAKGKRVRRPNNIKIEEC